MAGKRFSTMWRLVILLLVVWAALTVRLNASWFGRDGNGAWVSAAVRNYYRYGAGELGLMVVTNPGLVGPGAYHYYVHHPPLLVWSVAAATVPFGFNAAAERWVPIAATTISVAVFYALVRRLYQDEERAWWAAALYALTPMLLIFGRIPSHEALALMLIMLYLLALTHWLARPTRARWLAVLALAVIGMWTSWATILHVGVLTLYGLWQARGRHRIAIFAVGVIALGAFGLMLVYYQSQWDGAIDELLRAFVWRSSTATLHTDSVTFTLGQYIGQVFTHLLWMLTPTVLVLGVAGIVPAFRRDPLRARRILAVLFVINFAYLALLRNATYVHEFEKIYLLPPLAITGAGALLAGWRAVRYRRWLRPLLVGLLLSGIVVSVVFTAWNHSHELLPAFEIDGVAYTAMAVALGFNAHTTPDDLVMSNMPVVTPAMAYHADRNIQWEVTVVEALERAEQIGAPGAVYAFCGAAVLPDELATFPHETDGPCTFVRLR